MSEFLSSGRLEDHHFSELTGLIFREARTGELTLETGGRQRSVWFLGGNPVAVVSKDPQDHIAQLLLDNGKIDADDASRLADLPETRDALGSVDFIPKDTINWAVKSRFVNLCYDLFRWEEGDYAFREGDPPRDLFMLKVPAHSLIFKGVGLIGQPAVSEAVPDTAVCGNGPVPATSASYLSADVVKLLEECKPGLSVGDVLGSGWDDIEQTRRLIYALICLGLLTVSRDRAASHDAPPEDPAFGFVLDADDKPAPEPAPPPPPVGQAQSDFSLDLPPLEPAAGGPGSSGSDDFLGTALPSGGYPFEDGPDPGGFGSFDTGDTPGQDAAQLDETRPDDVQDVAPKTKKKGGRFSMPSLRMPHVPRMAGIVIGSVAAIGLCAFAGWWWMGGSQPPKPPVKAPVKPAAKKQPAAELAPAAPPTAAVAPPPVAPSPATTPASPTPAPAPATPVPAAALAPAPNPTPAPPAAAAPAPTKPSMPSATAQTPKAVPAPSGAAGGDRYRNAVDILRAGDYDGAAAVLESLLSEEHRGEFTVALLTACQRETIKDAFGRLSSRQLYLVTKKLNGRTCFRVCAGTYGSRDAAGRALAELPNEFRASGANVRAVADILTRDR